MQNLGLTQPLKLILPIICKTNNDLPKKIAISTKPIKYPWLIMNASINMFKRIKKTKVVYINICASYTGFEKMHILKRR